MKNSTIAIAIVSTLSLSVQAAQHEHDHISVSYQGKAATAHTIKVNQATLPPLTMLIPELLSSLLIN